MPQTVTSPPRSTFDDWQPLKLRAPTDHAATFSRPDLDRVVQVMASNRARFRDLELHQLCGRPLGDVRREARAGFLAEAICFTSQWVPDIVQESGPVTLLADRPLVIGGHQPVFFHPGVWAKNFAAARVAREAGGIAVNLIVDNDARTTVGISVPSGSREVCLREQIDYDDRQPSQPWEEARLHNARLFAGFADRLIAAMRPWEVEPLVASLWPEIVRDMQAGGSLVTALAAGRNRLERTWGIRNLELPVSRLSQLPHFLSFVADLLTRIPEVQRDYNEVVGRYRQVNRVRNAQHPVPDLRREGHRYEAPFWVWKAGESRRGRLFVETTPGAIVLTDGTRQVATWNSSGSGNPADLALELSLLEGRGWKLRPRALTLTLFARVFLGDLFVHGIGGAKYDEMTDRLIERLYGLAAPEYLVTTTTVHLPLNPFLSMPSDIARVQSQLREVDFHAERYLSAEDRIRLQPLILEKAELAAEQSASEPWRMSGARPGGREPAAPGSKLRGRLRFRRLAEINRLLSQPLSGNRRELEQELSRYQLEVRANRVLRSREFAFALFPADMLRPILQSVAGVGMSSES